ncbi:MAG: AI-2E family transporter [Bdellovibrio bacteriovorus]
MDNADFTNLLGRRIALGLFLGGLLVVSYQVLHLFLVPVAWAVILVYVTWPLHRRLGRWIGRRPGITATLMTLFLTLAFGLPLLGAAVMLRAEVPAAHQTLVVFLSGGADALPPEVARVPWLGPEIERLLELSAEDPAALRAQVLEWLKPWAEASLKVLGDIGLTAFKFAFALLTAFFLYRDGEPLLAQAGRLFHGLLGPRAGQYLKAMGDTTQAVLYGLVLTALLQGALAGIGYWAAGVQAPVLLGGVTAVFALVPFGTPVVWGLVSLWLFLSGDTWAGAGLAAWGAIVVSQIDNLFRPLVISSATRIPYILVLFGVLGGIAAFGLLGLFLGPIVIAVLLAVWREWVHVHAPPETTPDNPGESQLEEPRP